MKPEEATHTRRNPLRAWLGLILLVLVVLVLALGAGFYTGTLPRELLRAVLQASLAVKADVGATSFFGEPSVDHLTLHDADDPIEPPAIDLDNLHLDYRLRPDDGRYIQKIDTGALRLHFAQLGKDNTNYDFLRKLFEGPGGESDPLPYVPRHLQVGLESLEVVQPGADARIAGIDAEVTIEAMNQVHARLSGDAVPVRWRLDDGDWHEPDAGTLDLMAEYDMGTFHLDGTAQLPEFAALDADISGSIQEAGWALDATIDSSSLSGAVAGLIPEGFLPAPLRFDAVEIAGGHVVARSNTEGLNVSAASLEATVAGFELGPVEQPFLSGPGTVSVSTTDEKSLAITASLAPAQLRGELLSLLPENMRATPLTFDTAQLETLSAALVYSDYGWDLPEAAAEGQVTGVLAGPPEAPWFAGDVQLTGTATPGAEDVARFTLGLEDGQQAQVDVARVDDTWRVEIEASSWARPQMLAAVPSLWRDRVAGLLPTIEQASASTTYEYGPSGSTLHVTSDLSVAGQPGTLTYNMGFPRETAVGMSFDGSLTLAGGTLYFEGKIPPEGTMTVKTRTEGLPIGEWPRLLRPGVVPEDLAGAVAGNLEVARREGTTQLTANLSGTPKAFGDLDLSPLGTVSVKGTGAVNAEATRVSGTGLDVTFADGFELDVSQWQFAVDQARLEATMKLNGGIGWLAAMFSLPELYGDLAGSGTLTITPKQLMASPMLTSESLGYGNYAVPYKQSLAASGDFTFDYDTRTLTGDNVHLGLGEANTLTAASVRVTAGEWTAEELNLESDLSPLVAMELLTDATGVLQAQGRIARVGDSTQAALTGTLAAEALVLPWLGSRLEGVDLQTNLDYQKKFSGSGTFKASKLEFGGVVVDGIDAAIIAEDNALRLDGARPTVFGGVTEVSARVGVFEEGLPVRLRVYTHGADLARFTEEFKPPAVNLTGKAVGEIVVVIKDMTLSDIRVDLVAEEGFTVNRDLVTQALMQQYVTSMPGGMSMSDIIEDVVGKAIQRPFDRGRITLGFVDGRVAGEAVLESELLNLTVDITADPEAIIEAIRLRQRDQPH